MDSPRTLLLITNHFPFGIGETFLHHEIDYLTDRFDKVIILTRDITSTGERKGNFSVHRINPESNFSEKLSAIRLYLRNLPKVVKYMVSELSFLGEKKSFPVLSKMLHDLTKGMITARHIERLIKTHDIKGSLVLYSYWLTNSALATVFVRFNGPITRIARCHGTDVYEQLLNPPYLSFRRLLVQKLDAVFPISDNGKKHLENTIGVVDSAKIILSRLGTAPPLKMPHESTEKRYLLVSCSFITPNKRIERIIDALSFLKEMPITWIHIGDGILKEKLLGQASQKLSHASSLRYEFKGMMSNSDVVKFYSENYVHLFINTSKSEGIPVSVMEAQSFGIPVIATAVGGIPEIISDSNGRLFDADTSVEDIGHLIRSVLELPSEKYAELRRNSRKNWETLYCAERNFRTFASEIHKLSNETRQNCS